MKAFKQRLKDAGLNKTKFAAILGISLTSVSLWGDNPPAYALAYLDLYEKQIKLIDKLIAKF